MGRAARRRDRSRGWWTPVAQRWSSLQEAKDDEARSWPPQLPAARIALALVAPAPALTMNAEAAELGGVRGLLYRTPAPPCAGRRRAAIPAASSLRTQPATPAPRPRA